MSRWFRHYAGLCRDEKLVSVAIKSKQPIERVVWVWCAILESATEIDDNGRYGVDAAEIAYFLRADETDICSIENALRDAGRLAEGCVVTWSKRQFSSDRSKERVAAHRERKRADDARPDDSEPSRNGDVTLQTRYGNAPDTDTDTDTERKIDNSISLSKAAREIEPARPVAKPFPSDGSIQYGDFAEISRRAKPGIDPDVLAQAFRRFCKGADPPIPFDDPWIAKRFEGFAKAHRITGH